MITIFDFDYTIFDADRYKREGLAKIFNMSGDDFVKYYKTRFKDKGLNYDPEIQIKESALNKKEEQAKLGEIDGLIKKANDYLFPQTAGLLEYYKKNSDKIILVTHGDPDWQRRKISCLKINGVKAADFFDEIIYARGLKSEERQLLEYVGKDILLINDNAKETLELKEFFGQNTKIRLLAGPYSSNVSHDEKIWQLEELVADIKKIRIIILAAGKGTRMKTDLPKVLVPVKGKAIIARLLDAIYVSGIDNKPIVVASPENISSLKDGLKDYDIDFVIQPEQLGTGHAVLCAIDRIGGDCGRVLVFNGDHPFVKADTIKRLASIGGDIAMLTAKVEDFFDWKKIFYHWGRIIQDDEAIKAIVEFKDADETVKAIKQVNPAMYAFDTEWLKNNIKKINTENAQKEFYLTDLIKIAFEQGIKIAPVSVASDEVIGINSLEELEIAENL